MANALRKITTAAKKIRKRHPKVSWKSAIKKAGQMYRGGKLKKKRSVGAVKKRRKVVRRKRAISRRRKSVARRPVTRTVMVVASAKPKRRRRRAVRKSATRRRRVGGTGKDKFIKTLAIGGLAVGLLIAFTRKPTQTVYVPTGNVNRDSLASQILSYTNAALLSASQIASLINRINNSSEAQLQSINDNLNAGASIQQYA